MRKVLSFVLVLSLVLGSFSMAFAAESKSGLSDVAGIANEEAITVNVNLGIIDGYPDGTFGPEKSVTRAEFAKMLTKAMGIPESALAGYTKVSFKDTTGHGWAVPYLAFCESKGILNGYGDGTVRPGNTVTVNEAMTMVLRAVGFTANSADLVGVWPANYVTLAQKNGLYDKVASTVTADRASAAQIIYNVLTVQTVSVATDGKTTASGDCLLVDGLNCVARTFVVTGTEETLINLKPFVGKECKVFMQKDKPNAIVAIASEETTTVSGHFRGDTAYVTTTGIVTTDASFRLMPLSGLVLVGDDDYDYNVKAGDFVDYFYNGEAATPAYAVSGNYAITSDMSITITADISGKTISNVRTISEWNKDDHKLVNASDLNALKDDMLLSGEFETLKNGDIDTNSFELVGVSSLDKIAADNVVYIYVGASSGKITKVSVGTEVVTGMISEVKSNGKFIVNGKTYEEAGTTDNESKTPVAGDEVKLYLDAAGDVYKNVVTSGTTDKYAVVADNTITLDKIKLYTSDDESVWMDFNASKANLNNEFTTVGNIVAYGINKDGKITATTLGAVTQEYKAYQVKGAGVITPFGGSDLKVASDCVVFTVTGSGTTWTPNGVTSMSKVDIGTVTGSALIKSGKVVAFAVADTQADRDTDSAYAVFNSVSMVPNEDKDNVQRFVGFADGAALDKLATTDASRITLSNAPTLYTIKYNGDGLIKDVVPAENDLAVPTAVTVVSGRAIEVNGSSSITISGAGIEAISDKVVVYKANYDKDGKLTGYTSSSLNSIGKDYKVFVYDTLVKDGNKTPGSEVVIYITKADIDKHFGGAY